MARNPRFMHILQWSVMTHLSQIVCEHVAACPLLKVFKKAHLSCCCCCCLTREEYLGARFLETRPRKSPLKCFLCVCVWEIKDRFLLKASFSWSEITIHLAAINSAHSSVTCTSCLAGKKTKQNKTLISDVNIKLGFAITPFARWFPGNVGKHSAWRVFKRGRSSRSTSPHAESSHGDVVSTATAVTREETEPGRGTAPRQTARRTYGGIHLVLGWWVVLIEWQDVLRLAFMKQESSWTAAATTAPIFFSWLWPGVTQRGEKVFTHQMIFFFFANWKTADCWVFSLTVWISPFARWRPL